ncbi:transposase [Cucumis melo var. makuwa]|uniref:Transposase n=1 Tax=Cucumis melo var. makuwa TaxID=1194695 RepID=A0A5A7V257_CUCMM|nr:transposase [Cucumis melo var. makuwa]
MFEVAHKEYSKDPNGFEKLLIDAEKPLYEGCKKYTKLSTPLYNLKVRYGWSDISFSELLKTLKEILPTTNELPNSLYEAKKTLGALGMEYEKIHATECPKCGQSRWKNVKDRNKKRKQIPLKVIWYFPPIPRFKRLFRSIEYAENLTWHASERIEDGKLRHPADSPAWKLVHFKWPDFGFEPRNLRLALSADGVNPHGYKACPICGDNTNSIRLRHGKKIAYLGHRRFLARDHPYRRQKKSFNGKKELGTIPEPLSGEDVYLKLNDLEFPKGKKIHKNLSMNISEKICWNRLSSFFKLPYWKDLHVRHCLDVMHIEKNVCMNILGTLLNIPGKSKDGLNARRDLVDLKLRPELAPISIEKKIFIPPACYTLTKEENRCILKTLPRIKVPKGYSSNIRNLVSMTDLKLNSLKSHDCHVLIQQLFPIALRSVLSKHVRYAITKLCIFFNSVCNKVLDAQQLDKLEEDIVVTLCLFEKYFPHSYFTIMIHLTVHIVREVKLCGPIYLRWMYHFERFMKVIKNSVRNRYRSEGCIAESYLIEEAIEFCSDFLSGVDPVGLGTRKSQDHLDTSNIGRPLSMGVPFKPEQELLRQAHRYVLENTIDVQPYMEKHMKALQLQYPNKSKNQKWLQEEHNRTFIQWLREEVSTELEVGNSGVSDNLRWIAHGPHPFVITYSGYAINGCRYHTKSSEKDRSVQNSGVSLVAKTIQVSSSKDKNPVIGDMSFYGVIQEIWELNYNTFNVPVFKCDWVQNSGGVRIDELGYTLVDLNKVGHKSDSFILASQAKQVFYVEDPSDVRWSVVLTPPQRDFEDRYNDDELGDTILWCEGIPNDMPDVYLNNDLDENVSTYVRSDCEGTWILT